MFNPFANRAASLADPGRDYMPVVPDDATSLSQVAVALYVEVGGDVRFVSESGASRTVGVPDYGWILCGVRQVFATGTTADRIHAVQVG
jgi:hypothetical protein